MTFLPAGDVGVGPLNCVTRLPPFVCFPRYRTCFLPSHIRIMCKFCKNIDELSMCNCLVHIDQHQVRDVKRDSGDLSMRSFLANIDARITISHILDYRILF